MEPPSDVREYIVLVVAFPFVCILSTSALDRRMMYSRRVACFEIAQEQMKHRRTF
jgi:hypothetical protein